MLPRRNLKNLGTSSSRWIALGRWQALTENWKFSNRRDNSVPPRLNYLPVRSRSSWLTRPGGMNPVTSFLIRPWIHARSFP